MVRQPMARFSPAQRLHVGYGGGPSPGSAELEVTRRGVSRVFRQLARLLGGSR